MTDNYSNWRKRLAGEKVTTFLQPQPEDCGYYRRPITEPKLGPDGKTNGQKRIVGWEPVAYFMDDGRLHCVRGAGREHATDEGLWSWVCRHPISEEWYRAVAERGEPWPDSLEAAHAIGRVLMTQPMLKQQSDMQGHRIKEETSTELLAEVQKVANVLPPRDHNTPPEVLPEIAHATAIDNAIGAALKTVTTETEAAQALGSKNRIAELRLDADKTGKKVYQPPYEEYKRLYRVWTPMIERAEQAEKNLDLAIKKFRQSERERIAKEQAAAAAKQREIDEANERAAQRAIAAGQPEPEPEVVEPDPVPAQIAPLVATYGTRKLKEVERDWLDEITDYDAVYKYFAAEQRLKNMLLLLATSAIKDGKTVPGCKTHRGLV